MVEDDVGSIEHRFVVAEAMFLPVTIAASFMIVNE